MSIADKLTRLSDARDDTITALAGKGVTATGHGFEDFPSDIAAIPQGGSITVEPLSVTANGTYTAATGTAYSPVTVNVPSGGASAPKSDVNFIDYDGTILYSYTASEALALTELPANPSHSGLTSQGWNWTLAQIKAQLTAMPSSCVNVGQMYITDDNTTRIYCRFESPRLTPYLGLGVNGTVVVDWGDGSSTSTLTGTSLTSAKTAAHTYASSGDYTITITVSSGRFSFTGTTNVAHILKKSTSTSANISRVYANAVQHIEIGSNANIGNYAFRYCSSLLSITIPSGVTSIGTYAFNSCYDLTSITIPSGVPSIGNNMFNGCNSLSMAAIPSSVTSIDNYAFTNCYSITTIPIPSGVTSIGASVFSSCYGLTSITIPSGVTSIGNSTFSTCYGIGEIHLQPTTPPTVSNTNVWSNVQTDCIFYVPAGALSSYTSATNYPSSSSYTYIEE